VRIKEAANGESIKEGTVYICPGGFHLGLRKNGHKTCITLTESIITDKYIPSVDYMMKSVAEIYGSSAIGVILTGMGNDGKNGMLTIKTKGGYTIAESEKSAVVFGMPAEAIKAGAVETVLPVSEIPSEICRVVRKHSIEKVISGKRD
jgi:two-component system chemotaxis response regulator CheB